MGANAQTSVPAFTAGQVLTAAQVTQINTGIPVFASSTERDAAFGGAGEKTLAEGQMAYLEDTNATQYYDGSSWAAVAGGKILQVVSTTKTDTFSSSVAAGGTVDVTGLTATITPTAATSTILVNANVVGSIDASNYGAISFFVQRDSTPILIGDAASNRTRVGTAQWNGPTGNALNVAAASLFGQDSPATTSSITYKVTIHNTIGSTATLKVNTNAADGDFNYVPRTVSSITVMEVSA